MNDEMNISELIAELDKIDSLGNRLSDIKRDIQAIEPNRKEEENQAIQRSKKTLADFKKMQERILEEVASKLLAMDCSAPPEYPILPRSINHANEIHIHLIAFSLIPITILSWVILFTFDFRGNAAAFLSLVSILLVGASIAAQKFFPFENIVKYIKWYDAIKKYPSVVETWEEEFVKRCSAVTDEKKYIDYQAYEEKFLQFVDCCNAKLEEVNKLHSEKCKNIKLKYYDQHVSLENEQKSIENTLDSTTLIPKDLFAYSGEISKMLKQKRADTLKEAINLTLDEARKDKEERERQLEAERQERILREKLEEERRHNLEMEIATELELEAMREHNEAMERAAEKQASEANALAERLAREAQEQAWKKEHEARSTASWRCQRCANVAGCSVRGSDAAIGCPAFRPNNYR